MENNEELKELINDLLKLEKKNPEDVEIKSELGDLYYKLDKYEEAIEWYKKALEIKPDDYGVMNNLGSLYDDLGKYEEAIKWYKKSLEIKPDDYRVMNNLGSLYDDLGKYDDSIDWYKKALEIKPDYDKALYNIGLSYNNLDKYEESIDYFKKALEIKPDYYKVMFNIGVSYSRLDKYDEAIEWYKKALDIKANYYEAIVNIGFSYNKLFDKYIKVKDENSLISLYNECKERNSTFYVLRLKIASYLNKKFNDSSLINELSKDDNVLVYYDGGIIDIIEIFSNNGYSKYLNRFNYTTISEDCIDCKEHMIVKIIFERTNDFNEAKKILIRQLLIKLYKQVIEIKEKLRFKEIKEDNRNISENSIEICNYAKLSGIKNIIKKDKDKNKYIVDFRFSNVAYMNDPKEGKKFFELIENSKESNNNKKYNALTDEKDNNKVVYKSNTYFGCFSKNIDVLPLWVQYANNGEGCCLVFNKNIFDEKDDYCCSQISVSDIIKNKNNSEKETQKYVLYNVAYVDENNNIYVDGNLVDKDNMSVLFEEITKCIDDVKEEIGNKKYYKDNIEIIVNDILDQVKFLFKDKAYHHEQELRVIKFSDKPEVDDNCGDVPRLYLKFDRDIEFERAVLGPRIGEAKDIAQYLYHSGKVKGIINSKIPYRSK